MGKTLLLILFLTLAGCPPSTPAPSADEWKREQQKRVEAERSRDKEAASKSNWQTVAFFTGTGAVLMLIAGTILGSRARHHATRRK
jgi:cellobiose-specific phosphotransferase system component IIC